VTNENQFSQTLTLKQFLVISTKAVVVVSVFKSIIQKKTDNTDNTENMDLIMERKLSVNYLATSRLGIFQNNFF
jgi:hypothetical protein